jgi:hypothetical protein
MSKGSLNLKDSSQKCRNAYFSTLWQRGVNKEEKKLGLSCQNLLDLFFLSRHVTQNFFSLFGKLLLSTSSNTIWQDI